MSDRAEVARRRRRGPVRRFLLHLTPEWARCKRIARNMAADSPGGQGMFTPGQVLTMRRASGKGWGSRWL